MAMGSLKIMSVVFLLQGFCSIVYGLKCYKCDSIQYPAVCGRDFKLMSSNTSYIVDNCDSCLRTVVKSAYYRNCSIKTGFSFKFSVGCKTGSHMGTSSETCACNKDLCNGARSELAACCIIAFMVFFVYTLYSFMH